MKSATPCSKPCQSNGNLDSNATSAYSPTMTTTNIRIIARNVNRYENAIRIDPTIRENAKMTALGITPAQIKTAFAQTNYVLGNGNVADYNRLYLTLTDTRINDMEELRNVIVRNDGKRIVRLGDIATVEIQEQQEFLKINADGNDAVLVDLVKQPGVNLIDFAKQVESKADEIRQQLPAGYELKPITIRVPS